MCAIVVVFRVCKSVRLFEFFAVTSYKHSVNPIINSKTLSDYKHMTI
jgi:hypothetical protein